jgi:hypothetical protein
MCCLPVHSAGLHKQFWNRLAGRNGTSLFSVQCGIGRLSMRWGSRMIQSWILIDALSSAYWEKKNKGRYALLAVQHQDFLSC